MLARARPVFTNPWVTALLIALAAQVLFTLHIDRPPQIMFDETHYVPAARALLALSGPRNIEHPLLGKELIAASIALFGDNPFGWRMFASFAGTATVVAGFALLWLLLGAMRPAVVGATLLMLNQLVFVQARIAMLDVFLGALLLWAIVLMLWAGRGTPAQVRWRWTGASVAIGLAVAVKWAALPYAAMAAAMFLVLRRGGRRWPGLSAVGGLAILGGVSAAAYFLTFLPAFFYADQPLTLASLLPLQRDMYALQTQVLPAHIYQSRWWSWPLMLRPIWYFYEPDIHGVQRGVFLIGNPAILWGGLVAVVACLWAGLRARAARPAAVALLWIASLVIYIIIPKSLGFFYYYYLSGIFLCLAIAVAFHHFNRGGKRGLDIGFIAVALAFFVYFYPILSGAPLADDRAFAHWTWFPGWI